MSESTKAHVIVIIFVIITVTVDSLDTKPTESENYIIVKLLLL